MIDHGTHNIIHITARNAILHTDYIPKCLTLFREGFAEKVPTFNEDSIWISLVYGAQEWYVLVEDNGAPVSIAVVIREGSVASVWNLTTSSAYRLKGYAKALLAHIRAEIAGKLYIRADNPELYRVYESAGYIVTMNDSEDSTLVKKSISI
jgi:predicted GNAT family acetyltransferase